MAAQHLIRAGGDALQSICSEIAGDFHEMKSCMCYITVMSL